MEKGRGEKGKPKKKKNQKSKIKNQNRGNQAQSRVNGVTDESARSAWSAQRRGRGGGGGEGVGAEEARGDERAKYIKQKANMINKVEARPRSA